MGAETEKYIITGGPGSGKSTLVEGLEKSGYCCSAEISREMIKAEVARGTDCLPWLDIQCFSDKVILEMIRAWKQAATSITFFDRGIPDVIAYLRIANLTIPDAYLETLSRHPYQQKVFILPPWEDIYINDNERWQSFEESAAIYEVIKQTYIGFGFELVEVPKLDIQERIAFILRESLKS